MAQYEANVSPESLETGDGGVVGYVDGELIVPDRDPLVANAAVGDTFYLVEWGQTTVLTEGGQQVRGIPRLVRG